MDVLIDPGDPGHRNPVVLAAFILRQLDRVATIRVIDRGKLATVRAHNWHVRLDLGGVNGCRHQVSLQVPGRIALTGDIAEGVPLAGLAVALGTSGRYARLQQIMVAIVRRAVVRGAQTAKRCRSNDCRGSGGCHVYHH